MWPAEIKCDLLNHSYRGSKTFSKISKGSKLLTMKNKSQPLLNKVAAAVFTQKNAFDAAVKAFEIHYEVATKHTYTYNEDSETLDYDGYPIGHYPVTRSVDYTHTRVRSWYKNGTDEDRRKLVLDLEKRGFFQAAHGFDLKDTAHYRLICAMMSFYMYCVFTVQRAAEQGNQTPVPTLRECILDKKGIKAVAIDQDNHTTFMHHIDLLNNEYKTFQTVDYMIENEYYATENFLVAKLLATRLKEIGKEESVHLCSSESTDRSKVVLPMDIDTSTLESKPPSPIYGEVHMDDYYKAAWRRYKNCRKQDVIYYLNLMTDEAFYHTTAHAVPRL